MYHKLNLDAREIKLSEDVCCTGDISDKDEDIEILDDCFNEASNVAKSERASLYYICG